MSNKVNLDFFIEKYLREIHYYSSSSARRHRYE